jgi:hypothetical protein
VYLNCRTSFGLLLLTAAADLSSAADQWHIASLDIFTNQHSKRYGTSATALWAYQISRCEHIKYRAVSISNIALWAYQISHSEIYLRFKINLFAAIISCNKQQRDVCGQSLICINFMYQYCKTNRMHFLYSFYYELMASTCFEHYLLIFRKCCINNNLYIVCVCYICWLLPGLECNCAEHVRFKKQNPQ